MTRSVAKMGSKLLGSMYTYSLRMRPFKIGDVSKKGKKRKISK
jgi:hypothetical protein